MNYEFLVKAVAGKIQAKNPSDLEKALLQEEGQEMVLSLKPVNRISEKQRLYNYYFAAVIPATIKVLTQDGFENTDEQAADHYLKLNCAKTVQYNSRTDTEFIYLLEKRSFPLERLYQYVVDCLLLLELRHKMIVPDAQTWKEQQKKKYQK